MGLRFRDLMTTVAAECMAGGPTPQGCGCTVTANANAPQCQKASQKPDARPGCAKASAPAPPKKKALGGLEALRRQLRAELRTSG